MAAVAIAAAAPALAHWAGWVTREAARALVSSAALISVVPWLTWRVRAPSALRLIALYYCALVALVTWRAWVHVTIPWHRGARRAVALTWATSACCRCGAVAVLA